MSKIAKIVESYGVKLTFKKMVHMALYSPSNKEIIINKNFINKRILIPIIFHELGHHHCYENDLFFHYHHEDDIRLAKLTALKAERYVDKWAANEMKKHGYKMKYPMFYYDKNRVINFKKLLNQWSCGEMVITSVS